MNRRSATVPLNRNRPILISSNINNFPLKPACSLIIHKSLGGTFNEIVYKCRKAHSEPLDYAALSRVTTPKGDIVLIDGHQRFYYDKRNNEALLPLRNEFTRLSTVHLTTIGLIMINKMNGGDMVHFSLNCQSL
ncbi:ATP-dependent DNA helicase [Trichonephila clavipes]|nr:ATP-dependent DNA helicase [Trichonephila clavipes]